MKLGLVSCTKSKRGYPCKANQMYSPSNLFTKAYSYAKGNYDIVAILSAKHGLLLPDDEIAPYDLTLKTMGRQKRQIWSEKVFHQMKERLELEKIKEAYFHAGKEYRDYLIPRLKAVGITCIVPLQGLAFGQQLAWYSKHREL